MKKTLRAKNKRRFINSNLAAASRAAVETMESRVLLSSVAYSYVTDQNVYSVGIGQTVTAKVYLQETLNGNASIIDSQGENGLLGAGFEAVSGTRPASPSNITAINPDATDFGGVPVSHVNNSAVSNPNEADLLENIAINANAGVELGNSGAAADEVYLGSLTITGGTTPGATTFFKLGEYDVDGFSGGNTITNPDGFDVDVSGSLNGTSYTGVGATVTTFSVVTTTGLQPAPAVTVTSGNSVYNSSPYAPTTIVTGTSGVDSGAALTYIYYAGTAATGTPLGGAPTSVGIYTVVANFAGDNTYAPASSAPSTFQITAKPLTATISAGNKTYDGTTAAGVNYLLAGVVGSDAVTASGTATFSNKNIGIGKTVTATNITLSGAAAGNYSVNSSASTTANITTLAITGSITVANKIEDGTTAATIATRTLAGDIPGDAVSYAGGVAAFASTGPGDGIQVIATGLSLTGADAGNYTVNSTATTTANITSATSIVYSYVTDQNTYSVAAGQTVTVNVYLKEALNGNASIIDSQGENGLLGAGFEVVSATRPTSPSTITAINPDSTDFGGTPDSHINNAAVSNPNEADLLENIDITANAGVELGDSAASADEVYLGSLTVMGGITGGTTTTFKLGEYDVGGLSGGNTITNPDGYDLDTNGSVNGTSYVGAGTTTATFSVVTSGGQTTPTVTVTSGNSVYNGKPYAPATTVTGSSGTDSVAALTYAYYAGSNATGTPLSGAPATVGTYTVVASFAGDSTYIAANSPATTFAITAATPSVTVSDAGGQYSGSTFPATATVAGVVVGVDMTPAASLEGVTPTITYYAGSTATGTPLGGAPSAAGIYTAVANFPGSTDYAPAASPSQTFTITPPAPTVVSTQVGAGAVQRSTISSITVVFSEEVNFSADSFTLQETQNEKSGFTWTNVSSGVTFSNPSGDGITWVISVINGGSLDRTGTGKKGFFSDGIYQLLLNGSAITDAATGTTHFDSGNSQVATFKNGAGTVKNAFSVLFGDTAGTGAQIGAIDYGKLKVAYGKSVGNAAYNAALDYNGDGVINAIDFGKFKVNYGKSYTFT